MVLLEFSMSPMDKGESVSNYVSRSLKIISESGVDYRLNPMGRCYETMRSDCKRITCSVKIDYREGKKGRLISKIASVEDKLGKKLKV